MMHRDRMKSMDGDNYKYKSSLFLMRLKMRDKLLVTRNLKPPPPKRVSSAKSDTVKKEERKVLVNGDLRSSLHHNSTLTSTVTSQTMGSGSSIHQESQSINGTYTNRKNDLMSLSHARVIDDLDTTSLQTQTHGGSVESSNTNYNDHENIPQTDTNKPTEYDMVHRAPITSLQFNPSTFKGASMSALSMSLSQPETANRSFFSKKGKYKFSNNDLGTESASHELEYLKPTTVRLGSLRLHQSNSPDSSYLTTREPMSRNEESLKRRVSLGKSDTSGSSGSVSDLFQKSKSKVRNSLRNSKFFSRNLSAEDNPQETAPATLTDMLSSGNGTYDPTLVHPDSFEDNWLSRSHDSGLYSQHKAKARSHRTAVAVKIPTLTEQHSEKVLDTQKMEKNTEHSSDYYSLRNSEDFNEVDKSNFYQNNGPVKITIDTHHENTPITPEQESIEVLDCVIKDHSNSRYTTQTSIQSLTPSGGADTLHGTVVPPMEFGGGVVYSRQSSFKANQPALLMSGRDSIKGEDSVTELKKMDELSLPMTKPTCLPLDDTCQDTFGGVYTPSPIIYTDSGVVISQTRLGSPNVTSGMSVSDVLAQGYVSEFNSGLKANSSNSLLLNRSFNSQSSIYFDGSFADDDGSSFSESQEFAASDSEEVNGTLTNDITIRKTGWLIAKHLLTQKRGKLERAARRKWQKFWVKLLGDQLLFYEAGENSTLENTNSSVLTVSLDDALVQPVPEHVTRNNVMCLSTTHGHTYLLQASTQTDIDGWIQAIHIEAATSFAKQRRENLTRNNIERVLKKVIDKMKQEIDEDEKMRKMAELQMSLVSDAKNRRAISEQILNWEENSEKNSVHVFRFRCYIASLQGKEQPNPRSAISSVCKTSKQLLNGFKLFNIATLHSLVVSKQLKISSLTPRKNSFKQNLRRSGSFNDMTPRDDSSSVKSLSSQTKSKKSSLFGSLRGFDTWKGSISSGRKKKKEHQRGSVNGIISSFTPSLSSHSSETQLGGISNFPPISSYDNDVTMAYSDDQFLTPDTLSDDDLLDGFNSVGGSLDSLLLAPPDAWCASVDWDSSSAVRVSMTNGEFVTVTTTKNMTFQQLLEVVCQRKQLESDNHYITSEDERGLLQKPESTNLLSNVKCESLKVKKKRMYSVELTAELDGYGFSVLMKSLCRPLVIEEISPGGVAEQCRIQNGEEILAVNGKLTLPMNDDEAQEVLETSHLRLLIRTSHYETLSKSKTWWPISERDDEGSKLGSETSSLSSEEKERNKSEHLMAVLEDYLEKIIVPPPPITSKQRPSFIRSPFSVPTRKLEFGIKHDSVEDIVNMLIIPPPQQTTFSEVAPTPVLDQLPPPLPTDSSMLHSGNINYEEVIDKLLKKSETVTAMCRRGNTLLHDNNQSETGNTNFHHQLSDLEKIWKVINELVDTETNYVKDLDCLLKRFLQPLHAEGFLSSVKDMESLLHCVERIQLFQETFLTDLLQSLNGKDDGLDSFILNRSLISVSSTFLQHAGQFKLYAVFSTYHSVSQDLIEQAKSVSSEIRVFLEARNPKHQHSLSLDSYLIKPIQRVLKYPLLLRELLSLSETLDVVGTKSRRRLRAALHAMHAVARHINDSQTVHDEFGNEGFAEIMKMAAEKVLNSSEVTPKLQMSELLCYCTTEWQNVSEDISGKLKKGNIIEMLVFVFRSAIVLLCQNVKQRDKKKAATSLQETALRQRSSISDFLYFDVIPGLQLYINGKSSSNLLEVCNNSPTEIKTYRLIADSSETKQRIVKTMLYVIKDCTRTVENCTTSVEDCVISSENCATLVEDCASSENCVIPIKNYDATTSEDSTTFLDVPVIANSSEMLEITLTNEMETKSKDEVENQYSGNTDKYEMRSDSPCNNQTYKTAQSFFYRPDEIENNKTENYTETPSGRNSQNKILMTIPLPTYEVAVSSISNNFDEAELYSTHPRTSFHPVSPHHSVSGSVRSLQNCQTDSEKGGTSECSSEKENLETVGLILNSSSHDGNHGNRMNKYSKGGSPARYNMVYGVAPYESKL